MPGNRIVEVENVAGDPLQGYSMAPSEIVKYADKALALWHTHPGVSANLSPEDWQTFLGWGETYGYAIVGIDGVRFYRVAGRGIVNDQVAPPARRPRAALADAHA